MGAYAINGKDLQQAFGIIVESGSDTLLQLPKPKPFYKYDWGELDGVEVDMAVPVVYEPRTVVLFFSIIAANEQAFWTNYSSFEAELRKPGVQRLDVEELQRTFYVKYENSGTLRRLTRIRNTSQPVVARFSITFIEPRPSTGTGSNSEADPNDPTLLTYQWGYSSVAIPEADYSTFACQFSGGKGAEPVLDFTTAANYKFLLIRQPATAPQFVNWLNTDKNYGKFPDQIFYGAKVIGDFRYYVSRVEVLLDRDIQSIKLS